MRVGPLLVEALDDGVVFGSQKLVGLDETADGAGDDGAVGTWGSDGLVEDGD